MEDELKKLCKIPSSLPDDPGLKLRQTLENVQGLDSLLRTNSQLVSSSEILPYLALVLQPPPELLPAEQYLEDDPPPSPEAWIQFHEVAETALNLLFQILPQTPTPESQITIVAVALATYTDLSDDWTTPTSHRLASQILDLQPSLSTTQTLSRILLQFIKPLFIATNSVAHRQITPSGRISQRPSTNKGDALPGAQPWPTRPETLTILHYTIRTLSPHEIEESWPLIIPPLLTILDSPTPHHKTLGCSILTTLLLRLPPSLLKRTGLGPVFWDAVLPCLLCLPPLTPQSQSLPLLTASYTTMRTLAKVRTTTLQSRAQLLDVVVRSGILRGISFVGENVELAETLIRQLEGIVQDMGVWSVRHLKEMVKMAVTILANPFATTCPPLLVTTLDMLHVVIAVCWVRIPRYIPQILRGLTTCWKRILSDTGSSGRDGMADVKAKLKKTVKLLRAVDGDMAQLESDIVDVDERFGELFAQEGGDNRIT